MITHDFVPLWVALGAVPGALSRYYFTLFIAEKISINFPLGTFLINLSGAFLMGLVATLTQNPAEQWLNSLIIVGFLGSYTTFSTYILDLFNLSQTTDWQRVIFYGVGTPLGGLLGIELGIALAQYLQ